MSKFDESTQFKRTQYLISLFAESCMQSPKDERFTLFMAGIGALFQTMDIYFKFDIDEALANIKKHFEETKAAGNE